MATSYEQQELQKHFAITPKTASLLIRLGYTHYNDLHAVSPNHLISQLKALPNMSTSLAEGYRRAARRMVWLSTQEDPAVKAKSCPDWTQKGLIARGVWKEGYDDMTGDEAAEHFTKCKN